MHVLVLVLVLRLPLLMAVTIRYAYSRVKPKIYTTGATANNTKTSWWSENLSTSHRKSSRADAKRQSNSPFEGCPMPEEALAIIQKRYPAPVSGGEEDSKSNERSEPVNSQRVSRAKLTIFHFEELKRIASSLNFALPMRHTRDDPTAEIQLHD